jgi:hypothetical protein
MGPCFSGSDEDDIVDTPLDLQCQGDCHPVKEWKNVATVMSWLEIGPYVKGKSTWDH